MTIADQLAAAIGPNIDLLCREFGYAAALYRPGAGSEAADGTPTRTAPAVAGIPSDWKVIAQPLAQGLAQKLWGRETTATAQVVFRDNVGAQLGDYFAFSTGPLAFASTGKHYEAVEWTPTPAGAVIVAGLKPVPPLPTS